MMMDVISVECMRQSDASTIASGVSGIELMGRAARGIRLGMNLLKDWSANKGHCSIIAGGGNNGGDGYALACLMAKEGLSISVHTVSEKVSNDGAFYRDQATKLGLKICSFKTDDPVIRDASVLVDCIFGTGFHGMPRGIAAEAIELINQSSAAVVSADINSGLNGDTGDAQLAVKSDITVSVGQLKNGMFLCERGIIGKLVNAEIGINPLWPENLVVESDMFESLMSLLSEKGLTEVDEVSALAVIESENTDISPILTHGRATDFIVCNRETLADVCGGEMLANSCNRAAAEDVCGEAIVEDVCNSAALSNVYREENNSLDTASSPLIIFRRPSWLCPNPIRVDSSN